jgi:hypothetical protein
MVSTNLQPEPDRPGWRLNRLVLLAVAIIGRTIARVYRALVNRGK